MGRKVFRLRHSNTMWLVGNLQASWQAVRNRGIESYKTESDAVTRAIAIPFPRFFFLCLSARTYPARV